MKKFKSILLAILVASVALTGCKEHIASEEDLPTQAIDFTYRVIDAQYQLDYYVGSTIQFYPTVEISEGDVTWDFGDGTDVVTGDTVTHKYITAGYYKITAKGNGGQKTNVLYVSDIKPIVTQVNDEATTPEGFVEVLSSYVNFNVELPNPDSLGAIYYWTFPEGTTDENDQPVASFVQNFPPRSLVPDKPLGKVKFAKVGSQSVKLQVAMQRQTGSEDYRNLEAVIKNVQVALNFPAPTVYYAQVGGNIMALKIPAEVPEGIVIEPYDMGISSGQHMLNILCHKNLIYLLDAGKQFTYVDDSEGVMGDGKLTVMAADASTIETMVSNVGGTAFMDPFYGYIDAANNRMYFSDRNTGIHYCSLDTRNKTYNIDEFPYLVQNNYLGYYGRGMSYGSFNACMGIINDIWYWCKTDNGKGIYRFKTNEILASSTSGTAPKPASGHVFTDFAVKSYAYNPANGDFFVGIYGNGAGVYKTTLSQVETWVASEMAETGAKNVAVEDLLPCKLTFQDGGEIIPIDNAATVAIEGGVSEYVGVCQMALDQVTGDIYFGYRSSEPTKVKSGLIRYNHKSGYLEHAVEGVSIYGVCINPNATKLF